MVKEKLEQNQGSKPMSLMMVTISTGFVGGVFWSLLGYLAYTFHFTELKPTMILDPWTVGEWKGGWIGVVLSLLIMGLIGISAALIYYFTLKNAQSIWISALYGFILFLIVFFLLNPLFPSLNPVNELKRDTIITTVCLYILFGVFVGYSISYEYKEQFLSGKEEKEGNY